jgi:hypothetical protein
VTHYQDPAILAEVSKIWANQWLIARLPPYRRLAAAAGGNSFQIASENGSPDPRGIG